MADDSSITSWAANRRRHRPPRIIGFKVRPYIPLRAARRAADATAAAGVPPEAMTPTAANCDAPVNTSTDMA
ncbi:MAG TPA: hypothetical protein VFP02_03680 [Acidimicrobiales bacterium]|nr:hypothetical protein [Acidimicrobiales bacterium]